jgi:hypothetical protein
VATYPRVSQQAPAPFQIVYHVHVTGPGQVVATDLIPWSSARDQGLNRSWEVQAAPVRTSILRASDFLAWSDISEHLTDGQAGQATLIAGFSSQTSPAGVTILVIAGGNAAAGAPDVTVLATDACANPDELVPASSGNSAARTDEPEEQRQSGRSVYRQPLYRIAERSELGSASLSFEMQAAMASVGGTPSHPGVPLPSLDLPTHDAGSLPERAQMPIWLSSEVKVGGWSDIPVSLAEAVAALAVYQALHLELQQVAAAAPALRAAAATGAAMQPRAAAGLKPAT